jgi:hypothetical protein
MVWMLFIIIEDDGRLGTTMAVYSVDSVYGCMVGVVLWAGLRELETEKVKHDRWIVLKGSV